MNKKNITYKNKSGFGVDKDYFDDFEQRILSNIKEKEVMLHAKKMHGGMKVPENYFNDVENQILAKISSEEKINPSKVISLRSYFYWASAAILAILFTTMVFTQLNSPSIEIGEKNFTLSEISSESLESYIDKNLFGTELEYYLNGNSNYDFSKNVASELSSEYILDYLDNELYESDFLDD